MLPGFLKFFSFFLAICFFLTQVRHTRLLSLSLVGFWAHLHEPVKFSSSSLPLHHGDHCICVFFYWLLGFHGIFSFKVHLGFVIFFFCFLFSLLFLLVIHCQMAPLFSVFDEYLAGRPLKFPVPLSRRSGRLSVLFHRVFLFMHCPLLLANIFSVEVSYTQHDMVGCFLLEYCH